MQTIAQAISLETFGYRTLRNFQLEIKCRSKVGTPVKQNIVLFVTVRNNFHRHPQVHSAPQTIPLPLCALVCFFNSQIQLLHTPSPAFGACFATGHYVMHYKSMSAKMRPFKRKTMDMLGGCLLSSQVDNITRMDV